MPQYRRLGVPITHRSYLFKSGGCQSTPWVTSYGEIMENLLNLRLSISIRWCISQTPNQNCRSVGLAYRILMKRCLSASSRPSFLWWSSWLLPPAFPWRIQSCFADPLFSSDPNLQQSQKEGVRSRRPLLWNQMMIRLPLLQVGSRAQIMSLYLICWKYSHIISDLYKPGRTQLSGFETLEDSRDFCWTGKSPAFPNDHRFDLRSMDPA